MVKFELLTKIFPNVEMPSVTITDVPREVCKTVFCEYVAIGVRRKKRRTSDDIDGEPHEGPIPPALDHDPFPTTQQLLRFGSVKEGRLACCDDA